MVIRLYDVPCVACGRKGALFDVDAGTVEHKWYVTRGGGIRADMCQVQPSKRVYTPYNLGCA